MNFGKGIIIGMALFMSFILYLVFNVMSTNTDLESEDYYKREIEFGKEIQAANNANNATEKVDIKENDAFVVLQFPGNEKVDSLHVQLYRPNDQKDDKSFSDQETNTLMIAKKELKKGTYQLNIHYSKNGKQFLQKEELFIK
jgi:hypothetical protein